MGYLSRFARFRATLGRVGRAQGAAESHRGAIGRDFGRIEQTGSLAVFPYEHAVTLYDGKFTRIIVSNHVTFRREIGVNREIARKRRLPQRNNAPTKAGFRK